MDGVFGSNAADTTLPFDSTSGPHLHRCIIDAAGNRRLSAQYRQVEQQVRFYLIWSNELVGEDLPTIGRQHEAMIAALLSRDPTCAAREAYRHNESEGGKLAAAIHRRRWASRNDDEA